MARPKGARAADHALRRREMLDRIRARLGSGGTQASWRDMAAAAGVSLSSLTHHFGKRDDVILALLEDDAEQGVEPLSVMARPGETFRASVEEAVAHLMTGLDYGVGQMLAMGLDEGLGHAVLGPAFLDRSLEPSIRAIEARLQAHIDRGQMRGDARQAALILVSPLILAHLHQRALGGCDYRALDMPAFAKAHAEAFVRGHAVEADEA